MACMLKARGRHSHLPRLVRQQSSLPKEVGLEQLVDALARPRLTLLHDA